MQNDSFSSPCITGIGNVNVHFFQVITK